MLRIAQLNVRGGLRGTAKWEACARWAKGYDIVVFVETKLPITSTPELIPGYSVYRGSPRLGSTGTHACGGVLVYARHGLSITDRGCDHAYSESVWLKLD